MKPELVWPAALGELQLQMTQATFDTWLRDSTLLEYRDGVFVVGVKSGYAKDWLENRLLATVKRTLARLTGQPVEVRFTVVADEQPESRERPAVPGEASEFVPVPEPQPGEIAVELVEFDPTRKGYVQTPNYAVQFWQPYLASVATRMGAPRMGGLPFSLWLTLRSYAWGANRESWPSIEKIADICAGGNRHSITGRSACRGRGVQIGALDVLEAERLVWARSSGQGPTTRYWFRVLDGLPLLTPAQVVLLSPRLQRAHAQFVKRCEVDYEEWRRLTVASLASIAEEG
jgi:hypothetical protein